MLGAACEACSRQLVSPTTPGRALARLGHGTVVPFPTAYCGATRPGATPVRQPQRATEAEAPRIWSTELPWQRLGRAVGVPVTEAEPSAPTTDNDSLTDLNALVDALREAAELTGRAPQPSPWLPPLGRSVLIDELPQPEQTGDARPAAVPWALSDLPGA
ncbi:hypothetical protein [Streptomyces sp. UG1]|uniref:hypothetical protein n=1 Tax=Streptomyces sp. UG1 TaxID=3417652 RepID=UPI003CEFE054